MTNLYDVLEVSRKASKEVIDKAYRDYDLDDMIPIHYDASFSEMTCYRWYKVNNEAEVEDIEEAYDTTISDYGPFPSYVCIETEDDEYNGEA